MVDSGPYGLKCTFGYEQLSGRAWVNTQTTINTHMALMLHQPPAFASETAKSSIVQRDFFIGPRLLYDAQVDLVGAQIQHLVSDAFLIQPIDFSNRQQLTH